MTLQSVEELGFDPERLARVGARIDSDIEAGKYNGAAICVGRNGGVALKSIHGFADRAAGRKLQEDDVIASFSLGKQYTNAVVLNYIERGDLHLNMQVSEIIPEFGGRGKGQIKVHHLLTHTSGIMSTIPPVEPDVLASIEKLTDYIASQRPEALPGERVNYSILAGQAVLAEMVRRVDGGNRTFTEIVDDELFRPLGMTETSLGPRADLNDRMCPVVACYEESGMFDPAAVAGLGDLIMVEGCEIPAGGYLTTINDVHKFAQMLENGGELDGNRVLSPKTIEYCSNNFTGDKVNGLFDYAKDFRGWEPWPANIGMGFFVRGEGVQPGPMSNFSSPRTFCGWGAGSTCFWVDPESNLTFSFLSTGLMEETYHMERVQRLSDLVIASMVN
jgi:CubicO group peptidase (beta-lactamase class C family)